MKLVLTDSLEKIFAHGGPERRLEKFSVLKNQRYNMQLCVYNDGAFVTDLTFGIEGKLAKYCTARIVEDIPSRLSKYSSSDDYYIFNDGDSRIYPDLLRPFGGGDILMQEKSWKTVWITLDCSVDAEAGESELSFSVTKDGATEKVCVKVEVIDVALDKSDLLYTNWFHYDAIANYYKVEPWSDEYYLLLGTFVETAVRHGVNIMYVPLFTPPLDTQIGKERLDVQLIDVYMSDKGEYDFDFKKLDRFVDFVKSKGINLFEMSHLTTQWGAKACPKIMARTKDGYEKIFGWETPSSGDEYKKFLAAFLPKLDKWLKNKGIAGDTLFHISDEPNEAHFRDYKVIADYIKSYLKDYKILDAASPSSKGIVDIPVPSTTHLSDTDESDWVYYCCTSGYDYLSNRFFNMPSLRNRIFGLQLYERNVKGFLHWGFNFYNTVFSLRQVDPFTVSDGGGAWPSGDTYVVYPGNDGAWDSLRLEVFFEGLTDRMACKLLEKYAGKQYVIDMLHKEGLFGWKQYPRDDEWFLNFRQKINLEIKKHIK